MSVHVRVLSLQSQLYKKCLTKKKKTIFLLTILLMAIFVTSCSSDDDNEKTEFTSTLTVNGSAVKITNLEGKAIANSMFEFWVNDATSDFYIQGNIDYREELTTGKDVTKGCKMSIALVKLEEWYSSEKEYVLLQLKNGIWKISELHLYLRIINANRVQRVLF